MRTTDADYILSALNVFSDREYGNEHFLSGIETAREIVKDAPTIEPKPQWVPVTERLPENAAHPGAFCPKYMVMTKYGVTEGWYNPDKESWFMLFWFMTERLLEHEINFESGDIPRVVKVPLHMGIVTAWLPLPEPYNPEGLEDRNE